MSTRIRLRRLGANKRPYYRVVVADQRAPRDGRFIENIGKYHPLEDPSLIEIDQERALHWLRTGAQPSAQVRNLMVKIGIWDAFVAERPSAAGQVRVRADKSEAPKLSKKAAAKAAAAAEEKAAPAAEEKAAPAPKAEEPAAEVTEAPEPEVADVEAPAAVVETPEPEAPAETQAAVETETEPVADAPAEAEPEA
ncbi:MAG: 30S ribosomal protein S16 [Actinomycetota bacterium]